MEKSLALAVSPLETPVYLDGYIEWVMLDVYM